MIAIAFCFIFQIPFETTSAEPTDDISYFDVRLVDNEGQDNPNVLSHRYVMDTITDSSDTIFILRAQISLQASPANLLIKSEGGDFNCYVSVTGLSSYLKESGMKIEFTDGDDTYHADLRKEEEFTSYVISNDDDRMILQPNVMYPISITTLDTVEYDDFPEDLKEVVVTFTVHLKDGIHQIAFFSEGELIEAYKLADGQSIRPLPTVEREGYNFEGWFLKSGEPIQEGYVVTADDGDFISYAKWSEAGSGSHRADINWIILLLIIALIIGMIIMILAYRRRKSSG